MKSLLYALIFICAWAPVRAQSVSSAVAVLDFEGTALSPAENQVLSEKMRSEVLGLGIVKVLERVQMDAILREQGFQQSGACSSQECIVQMGQLLGVDKMIAGSVGKLGETYLVSSRLIDLQTGQIERMVSEDCACKLEELLPVVHSVAGKLFQSKEESTAAPKDSVVPMVPKTPIAPPVIPVAPVKAPPASNVQDKTSPMAKKYFALSLKSTVGNLVDGLYASDSSIPAFPFVNSYKSLDNNVIVYSSQFALEIPLFSWLRTELGLGMVKFGRQDIRMVIRPPVLLQEVNLKPELTQQIGFLQAGAYLGYGEKFWWFVHVQGGVSYYTGTLSYDPVRIEVRNLMGTSSEISGIGNMGYLGAGLRYQGFKYFALAMEFYASTASVEDLKVAFGDKPAVRLTSLQNLEDPQIESFDIGHRGFALQAEWKFGQTY